MNGESEYLRILRLYGQLIDSLKGVVSSDNRLIDGQALAFKLFDHAAAAYSLANGTDTNPILGREGNFIHIASLNVLARTALETYLLFYHIFIAPETDDEFEFRYCVWQLLGFAKREEFAAYFPPPEGQERLEEQKKLNRDLLARIQQTNRFKSHSAKTRKKILKGQWRFPKWIDIANSAGIGPQYSRALFAFLSDYAHSGSVSALQMGPAVSIEDRHKLVRCVLDQIKSIVSKMIMDYVDKFPSTREVLNGNPEAAGQACVYAGALSIVG